MKVAINTRLLIAGAPLEGVARYTWEVARRLVALHPDWQFYFFFDRSYDSQFVPGPNVTPVVLHPPARHPLLFVIWFECAVVRALHRYRIDVFYSPDIFTSLRAPCKTLLTVHDLAFAHYPGHVSTVMRLYFEHFMPRMLRRTDRILAVSRFTLRDIEAQYPDIDTPMAVAYNDCRPAFRPQTTAVIEATREQYASGQAYWLYVGSLHPRKNVARLIQAYDRYRSRPNALPYPLLLVGRMAWKTDDVQRAYEQATHKSDIVLTGVISDQELPRIVGAAYAMVYVSLFEGFGLPVLEAMRSGIPVITTAGSSMAEVAQGSAILTDATDVEAIADSMSLLADDLELYQRCAVDGRAAATRFSWSSTTKIVSEHIAALYGEVL